MRTLGQIAASAKVRLIRRRLPFVVNLRTFDASGVRFEVSNLVEYFRVVEHGDETEYTAAMLGSLREDDVLYDIGGNVGMVALHAAKTCTTVAFEPDPSYRRRLEVNAGLNPARRFLIEPIAIGDCDGKATLYTDGVEGNSPSLVERGERGSVSVATRTLDSLIAEERLPIPTAIKLDIEGAEILALRGGVQLLTGPLRPRVLFIEVHDTMLEGFGSSSDEVYSLLAEYGYTDASYSAHRNDQTHLILHAT